MLISRRRLFQLAGISLAGFAEETAASITFTDVTSEAGLANARNVSGASKDKQFLLEEMGCGAAFFDFDNDGWLDIFLVNGSVLTQSGRKPRSFLFRNNRNGTF